MNNRGREEQVATRRQRSNVTVNPHVIPHQAVKYGKIFLGIAITQIILGVLCIAFGALHLVSNRFQGVASGLWSGGWYIIVGSVTVATSRYPNLVRAISMLSIISCICAAVVLLLEYIVISCKYCRHEHDMILYVSISLSGVEFILAAVCMYFGCKGGCSGQKGQIIRDLNRDIQPGYDLARYYTEHQVFVLGPKQTHAPSQLLPGTSTRPTQMLPQPVVKPL